MTVSERLTVLEGELRWIRGTGWKVVAALCSLAILFITWYLPKELNSISGTTDQQVKNVTELTDEKLSKANSDMQMHVAQQLDPIKSQLSYLTALLELNQPNASQRIPEIMKKSLAVEDTSRDLALRVVQDIARIAKERQLRSSAPAIAEIGQEIEKMAVSESALADVAWSTVTSLMDYRSFLNEASAPSVASRNRLDEAEVDWYYGFLIRRGTEPPPAGGRNIFTLLGPIVSEEDAARWEKIGETRNAGHKGGSLIVAGAPEVVFTLDGSYLKNVILRNATIEYNGGPLILENVYFVNCRFLMPRTPRGRDLGREILASASTTFKAG